MITKLVGGWLSILKNDGVKVNGFGMTSHILKIYIYIYKMENHIAMFQTSNQIF